MTVIQPGEEGYPHNPLHVVVENANAKRHSDEMLNANKKNFFSEKIIDNFP